MPYKVKVIVEDDDGTELYWFYPLGPDTTVRLGNTIRFEHTIGLEEA